MIIRQENRKDYQEIYKLVKDSFETAKVSNGKEHEIINELRAGSKYIPELALVVEEQERLIAYIMLTKFTVNFDSPDIKALLLAPVCVMLGYRNEKIGENLINKSLKIAKSLGFNCVFSVGDPNYFYRLGFRQAIEYNIKCSDKTENKYVLVKELVPGTLKNVTSATVSFL